MPCENADADDEPDAPGDFSRCSQPEPDDRAEEESQEWQSEIRQRIFATRTPDAELPDHGQVHTHETKERSKVQNLGSELVAHHERPEVSKNAHQPDIL